MSSGYLNRQRRGLGFHFGFSGQRRGAGRPASRPIQMMFDNVAVMLPDVQRGTLRGLAITSPKRSALVPDLPTLREIDLAAPGVEDPSYSA
jgi:hypothetical protein